MTESRRIGILLFLYTRNELSSDEQKELLSWRKKDPENEKLFFEMTSPESLRREMQSYYHDRDRDFEKLQVSLPELAGTSLSGTIDEAIRVFNDIPESEERDPRYQRENLYSKSGLSSVEYWGSMISNVEDETAEEAKAKAKAKENPVVAKVKSIMPKKRWQRRIVRTIVGIAASWASLWIYFNYTSSSRENMEAVVINTDGLRVLAVGFTSGKLAGLADVDVAHTEREELINIVHDQPKRKKDKYYPLITDPAQEHLVLLPDSTRAWMNASSTIRYPANFGRDTIKLELDGEVFIEVSKNSPHHYLISRFPYSVNTAKGEDADENPVYKRLENSKRALIHALPGARLNFSTYPGHHETLVTTISGPATQLDSAGPDKTQLVNGQQVSIINDSLAGAQMIDTSQVIAWARGEFNFRNAPIQSITQELERWYNISVVYHGQIPDKGFTLQVPRSTNFSKVQILMAKQGLRMIQNGKTVNIYF